MSYKTHAKVAPVASFLFPDQTIFLTVKYILVLTAI